MTNTLRISLASFLILFTIQSKAADTLLVKNPLQHNSLPFIGAQIFIEPGQSKEEIESWFKTMSEHKLTACRIRMFESYMRDVDYHWNFELFDHAFKAADKYGIRIWATLYPVTGDNINIGGDKFPDTMEKQASIARYIEKTVNHFKTYDCLTGWVLINEPGVRGEVPENEFAAAKFAEWEKENRVPTYSEKGYPILMDFQKEKFLLDYTTWFLDWVSNEIRKYDQEHDLHVNNHDIFVTCSEYNFPKWRSFLSSLGGSAHASWHFRYFTRDKYAIAMSADCEMILSGAGDLPWLMTEIQGGNNTYSGFNPMCPTYEEIKQWLWITLGTEGKGAIFWTLNPRSSGIEAGEWGMIDFQGEASDRLIAAGEVAEIVQKNVELFSKARKAESHLSILYSREALWAEKQMTLWESDHEARHSGAVMKSALAWFEAFSEMGISPNLKAMDEFDFSGGNHKGETVILSHQLSLSSVYKDSLEDFVQGGGKLIVDGLTAYFDENMLNTMLTGFDYEELFGGNVSEFKFQTDVFKLNVEGLDLPAHMWKGYVSPTTGEALVDSLGNKVGIRNQFGKGEVIWIPAPIGLGARLENDFSVLQQFILKETEPSMDKQIVRFQAPHKKMMMKTMQSGDEIITILVNKNDKPQRVQLLFNSEVSKIKNMSTEDDETLKGGLIILQPEETQVILWRQDRDGK